MIEPTNKQKNRDYYFIYIYVYMNRNQVFTKSGKGSCAFLKPEHVTGTPISEAPTLVTGETVPPTWSSTETAPSTWSSTETASLI